MPKMDTKLSRNEWRVYYDRTSSEPMLGEFLIQQNTIQIVLSSLITSRGFKRALIDKKFIKKLENSTLGTVILFYQLCACQTPVEINLVKYLQQYNTNRNELVHKLTLDKAPSALAKKTVKLGRVILNELFNVPGWAKKETSKSVDNR